ncbi:MAG TPA: hypothetical protein VFX89_01295 [Gammaproteobacteria bacterium]|nr:hypothetical protein [Gammaproteobacteria bacterium]
MEAHPRRKPILTLKEALVELSIVVAGILIALSLDGLREWQGHRSLAAEARSNLLAEIRGNKAEIDRALATYDGAIKNYNHARAIVQRLINEEQLADKEMSIGFELARLSRAAYDTAEITGAFGHMKYQDVRRFAGIYDLQRKYETLQDQSLSYVSVAAAPASLLDEPRKPDSRQLEDWRSRLEQGSASLYIQRTFGDQLSRGYGELLTAEDR